MPTPIHGDARGRADERARTGALLRRHRGDAGWRQNALAGELGISASHLSQIESGQRTLTPEIAAKLSTLLPDFAATLDGLDRAGVDTYTRDKLGLTADELVDLEGFLGERPELAEKLDHLIPRRSPADAVSTFVNRSGYRYDELEWSAESLRKECGVADELIPARDLAETLTRHLEAKRVVITSAPNSSPHYDDRLRHYERDAGESGVLYLSRHLQAHGRAFELATQAVRLRFMDAVASVIETRDDGLLRNKTARDLAESVLVSYTAGAILMPPASMTHALEASHYNWRWMEAEYGYSFEQLAHRVISLEGVVPHKMLRIDIAGNVTKYFVGGATPDSVGLGNERLLTEGNCAKWNVFRAFFEPGMLKRQISVNPDGTRFFSVARTVPRVTGHHGPTSRRAAIALSCDATLAARKRLYEYEIFKMRKGGEAGVRAREVTVGPGCRLCPRSDCLERAVLPDVEGIEIAGDTRGISKFSEPSVIIPPLPTTISPDSLVF